MSTQSRWFGLRRDTEARIRWAQYARDWEQRIHSLTHFVPDALESAPDSPASPLAGLPFAVKDNIAVEGLPLTCGSRFLERFVAPYSATAVTRLQAAGATVVAKANLDEFAMGSATQTTVHPATCNPWNLDLVPGGSSGGPAAAVAAGIVPFALGSDTGGSVRQPASFCGVFGLKPTYGTVSRYGLVAYASSLDVIGVAADSLALTREVYSAISGMDAADHSSVSLRPPRRATGPWRVAVPEPAALRGVHPAVVAALERGTEQARRQGWQVSTVSLRWMETVVAAYYVIATAEASANLARFDSVVYGRRDGFAGSVQEVMTRSRSQGLGEEVKLRILLGTFVLRSGFQDQYYQQALRVRTQVRRQLAQLFEVADLLMLPVFPTPAFPRAGGPDGFQQKLGDVFTCVANLAGVPALAFPLPSDSPAPVGLQLMGPHFSEPWLFAATSQLIGSELPARPPGYSATWEAAS